VVEKDLYLKENRGFNSLDLPVTKRREEIKEAILANDTVIITGETGSGKTTQIPLMILESVGLKGKVAVTQPRVIAARSVAEFVAKQVGINVGEEVGYHVRFDDKTSEGTNINFMTEGILLKMMEGDPLLSDYAVVMVDEVHERNIDTDLILGMVKRIQPLRKEKGLNPLKVVVTSATMEKEKLSNFFDDAPVIEVKGRTFPVRRHYLDPVNWLDKDQVCPDATPVVQNIFESNKDGDILIFVPGISEIQKTISNLKELVLSSNLSNVEVLPLHGQLSPEEQRKIFADNGTRKIIVSTNVAESSITVPRVKHVIDTGLVKRMKFNSITRISELTVEKQTQDCLDQREGRAGRVSEGDCYRLYSRDDYEFRKKIHTPEIVISDLSGVILKMRNLGINDIESFDFIDSPGRMAIESAIETLIGLGALDENEDLTDLGKEMMRLPLEPHLAKMVIESKKYDCEVDVTTIAAFVGLKSVFRFNSKSDEYYKAKEIYNGFKDSTSDFLTLLNIWKAYESNGLSDVWARNNFLNYKVLREANEVRNQLLRILGVKEVKTSDKPNEIVAKSIALGLSDRLVMKGDRYAYFSLTGYTPYYINPGSVVFSSNNEFITSMKTISNGEKEYLHLVQRVEPEWIIEMVPHLIREIRRPIRYDSYEGVIKKEVDYVFRANDRVFYEKFEEVTGNEEKEVLGELLADGEFLTYQDMDNVRDVIRELEGLALLYRGEDFSYSREKLVEIYRNKIRDITSAKELREKLQTKQIDLSLKLEDFVPSELIEKIRKENPDHIKISDNDYKIEYEKHYSYNGPEIIAVINFSAEEILKGVEIPKTIFGRKVLVRLSDGQEYRMEVKAVDNELLKEEAARILVEKQWREFGKSHVEELKPIAVTINNIMNDTVVLPEGVVYGKDPITGKDLVSVSAVVRDMDSYEIRHFLDERQANLYKVSKSEVERTNSYQSFVNTYGNQLKRRAEERVRTSQDPVDLIMSREPEDIIEEVKKVRPQQSGRPRHKALLWGVLISRGLDVVDKAEITVDECQNILPELEKAYEFDMVKKVKQTILVLKGAKNEMVKEYYISEDKKSLDDFKKRLMILVKKERGEIDDKKLDEMVFDVINEMLDKESSTQG
jgi:HrpA-like RNA helicase